MEKKTFISAKFTFFFHPQKKTGWNLKTLLEKQQMLDKRNCSLSNNVFRIISNKDVQFLYPVYYSYLSYELFVLLNGMSLGRRVREGLGQSLAIVLC